jgi:hypothetical protein
MRIITWNMRGSGIPGVNGPDGFVPTKWTTDVTLLLRELDNPVNVLLLQECGDPPENVQLTQMPMTWSGSATPPGGLPIGFFSWNIGTAFQPRVVNLLWAKTDFEINVRNMAVVFDPATVTVSSLLYVPNPLGGLPSLGIAATIAGKQCNLFSLEAFAGTGADAQSLVAGCAKASQQQPWFVAGTFNRAPESFPIPQNASFCPHGTQLPGIDGEAEVNYAVNSGGAVQGQVLGVLVDSFLPILYAD